jgi:hypothetical protein
MKGCFGGPARHIKKQEIVQISMQLQQRVGRVDLDVFWDRIGFEEQPSWIYLKWFSSNKSKINVTT